MTALSDATEAVVDKFNDWGEALEPLAQENYDLFEALESDRILEQAEALGVTRDELREYAEEMKRAEKASSDLMALKMAKNHFEELKGVEELTDVYDDYIEALDEYQDA